MTVTNDEPISPPAETVGGAGLRRQAIVDVEAYLDTLPDHTREGLRALGDLLVGVTDRPPRAETADRFTARALGVADVGMLIDEDRDLNPVSRLTTAIALAEWITAHTNVIEVGPGKYAQPPMWTQTEIDAQYGVHQIKEKFGTLRYYCAPSNDDPDSELLDRFDAITGDAERASAITCERCGEHGVLQRTRYWAKTLCHSCADPLGYVPAPQDPM